MKKLKLKKLSLKNFKGVKDFTFTPDGQDSTLYGDNGSGKSTCADAYAWLLTDSDSQDNGKFQIKEFDAAGKVKQNVIHSVEGIFDADGEELTLRKEYREVFIGKGINKVFDGNKTLRFINELSVSKQKYQAKLEEFAPKNVFKSLLNPAYFSAQKTDVKRALILGLIDDVTQDDVIASDKKLAPLPEIIKSLSPEEYKSVAQKQKSKLKKQRDEIPVRIDEILRNQPDVSGVTQADIEKDIKVWEEKKAVAEKELFQLENGGNLGTKEQELSKIKSRKLDLEIEFSATIAKDIAAELSVKNKINSELDILKEKLLKYPALISAENSKAANADKEMKKLRAQWKEVKAEKYTTPPEVCPECGQKIPKKQHAAAYKKGLEKFNTAKVLDLNKINSAGKQFLEQKNIAETRSKDLQKEHQEKKKAIAEKEEDILSITEVIATLRKKKLESPEYVALVKAEAKCKTEIEKEKAGDITTQKQEIREKIGSFEKNIEGLKKTLARIQTVRENETRIKELKKEQKQLSRDFETLEKNIALTDLYIKKWVEAVEKPVNSLFEITTFKMFEEQVNGGIKDTCVAMFEGVPYGDGLNKGHKKIIGLDIIKTFSKHYDVALPIFVDDAEGVTALPEMDCQIIRLVKPEITAENKEYYSTLQTKPFNRGEK